MGRLEAVPRPSACSPDFRATKKKDWMHWRQGGEGRHGDGQPDRSQDGWGGVLGTETSLLPLPRWEQLEALKKEKETRLASTTHMCSFLQECGSARVQMQDMVLQLEALELGHLEDSHHILQVAQQKMPALERSVHYLQRAASKYSLGSAS